MAERGEDLSPPTSTWCPARVSLTRSPVARASPPKKLFSCYNGCSSSLGSMFNPSAVAYRAIAGALARHAVPLIVVDEAQEAILSRYYRPAWEHFFLSIQEPSSPFRTAQLAVLTASPSAEVLDELAHWLCLPADLQSQQGVIRVPASSLSSLSSSSSSSSSSPSSSSSSLLSSSPASHAGGDRPWTVLCSSNHGRPELAYHVSYHRTCDHKQARTNALTALIRRTRQGNADAKIIVFDLSYGRLTQLRKVLEAQHDEDHKSWVVGVVAGTGSIQPAEERDASLARFEKDGGLLLGNKVRYTWMVCVYNKCGGRD